MKIVFMGTPQIAADCLHAVLQTSHEVMGVFTQPDRPKGRGHKLAFSEVKELALTNQIAVYQPEKLKGNVDDLEVLKNISPDIIVVVAYGMILPQNYLDVAPSINVHASLLPKLRGAAPVQRAIIDGYKTTGVTTMFMSAGLDTGDMLEKIEIDILPNETSGELFQRISKIACDCLLKTLEKFQQKTLFAQKQNNDDATWASPLYKEIGNINFENDTQTIHNQIRGCNPSPIAYTNLNGKMLKVYKAAPATLIGSVGELLDSKKFIVGTKDGSIEFLEVVLEGGKRNTGNQLINGQRISKGIKLG